MKQWMRRFFAVLMMACLLAGNAWAEETALVDVNELLDSVITAELSDNALNFDAAYTLNALNDASQNAASSADEWGSEGGDLLVVADGSVVSMAVRYYNTIVAVSNSDIKTATSFRIFDLNTGNGYPAQISGEENSLIFFKLDEMPDVEKLYMTNGIPAGATVGTNGGIYSYYIDGDSIRITKVQVTRPTEGELFGTYSGAELMQGSPIFFFTDDKERVTIGLADKNHRYLDLYAYYELTTAANSSTAAPTAAPTSAPTTAPTAVPQVHRRTRRTIPRRMCRPLSRRKSRRTCRPLPPPPHRRKPPQPNPRRKPCSTSSSAFLRRQSLPLFSRAAGRKAAKISRRRRKRSPFPRKCRMNPPSRWRKHQKPMSRWRASAAHCRA